MKKGASIDPPFSHEKLYQVYQVRYNIIRCSEPPGYLVIAMRLVTTAVAVLIFTI